MVSSASTWMILFCVGDNEYYQNVVTSLRKDGQIKPKDINDVLFVCQGVCWKLKTQIISVKLTRKSAIDKLGEFEAADADSVFEG